MSAVLNQKGLFIKSVAKYTEFQKQVSTQVVQLSKKVETLQSQSSSSGSVKVPAQKNIPNKLSDSVFILQFELNTLQSTVKALYEKPQMI